MNKKSTSQKNHKRTGPTREISVQPRAQQFFKWWFSVYVVVHWATETNVARHDPHSRQMKVGEYTASFLTRSTSTHLMLAGILTMCGLETLILDILDPVRAWSWLRLELLGISQTGTLGNQSFSYKILHFFNKIALCQVSFGSMQNFGIVRKLSMVEPWTSWNSKV